MYSSSIYRNRVASAKVAGTTRKELCGTGKVEEKMEREREREMERRVSNCNCNFVITTIYIAPSAASYF